MKHRFLLVLVLIAAGALASDGRYEISQHCISLGCFPGDSGGLPITITQPGSYVLTSNITTGSTDQNLIIVSTDSVSIDLNGFSLIGPITCTGTPNVCSGSGTGVGIRVDTATKGFRLTNGTIRGMGGRGIAFQGHGARSVFIDSVNLIENAGGGLSSGTGTNGGTAGVAQNITALRNGNRGISVQSSGQLFIKDSTSQDNTGVHQSGLFGGYCANNVFRGDGSSLSSVMSCKSLGNNFCEWAGGSSSC